MNDHLLEDPVTEGLEPEYICPVCGDTAYWCPERD
jgi:hypothetical protein